jgi:hypothetical protein
VLVTVVVVILLLALVVPAQYPEHQTLTLDSAAWHQTVCVPDETQFGGVTTNVSFTWWTPNPSPITLQASYIVWPAGAFQPSNLVVYSDAGTSGSGWYTSGPYPANSGSENFDVIAGPGPLVTPVYVNISYVLPGHVLGGPATVPGCNYGPASVDE